MSFVDELKENIRNVLGGKGETVLVIKKAPVMSQRMDVFELPEPPEAKSTDYLEAMRGWVYIAVKAIAQEVAKIELVLYKKRGGKVEMVEEHELLDLIDRVNPFMTKGAFLEAIQSYLELVGEAFVWKYKEGNRTKQMWLLRPDFVDILPPKEGEYIGGYKYKVPGMKSSAIYPVDEVIHFKEFDPTNPYRGRGPLMAAAYAYDTDLFASKWNRNFFYNNAMPTTLLTTEQNIKGKEIERIRVEWENKFGGVNKAHKMAILTGGLKVDDVLKQSIKDMDFLNLRKFSRDEIFTIFQVPKTIVSITEDVNRANAREGKAVWIENVIKPKMSKLVSFLNEFYVPEWGEEYYLGYKDPSPQSVDMNIKLVQVGAGILTINERRELLDYDEIEGGDVIYTPATSNSDNGRDEDNDGVDDSNDQTDDDGEGKVYKIEVKKKKVKAVDDGVIVHHKTTTADKLRRKILQIVKEKGVDKELKEMIYLTMNKGKDERVKVKKKDDGNEEELGVISQEKKDGFWKAMILRSEPQELQFGLMLKMYWMKQMKRLIDRMESGKGFRRLKGVDNYLYDVDEENNVMVEVVEPLLKRIVEQAGADALKLLGLTELFNYSEEVEDIVRRYGLLMAGSINETTRARLREVLIEGIANHESIPQLAKRIRGVYDEADKGRASMIARTETMRANNLGHLEGYKQSGVVEMKEWMVALDERTCQYCLAMEKEYNRVGLDDNFLDMGESLIGEDGGVMRIEYSGLSAPPLHPSCRCVLLPVVRLTGKALVDRHEKVKQLENARIEEEAKLDEVKKKIEEVVKEVEVVKKEKLAEVDKEAELVMSKKLKEAKERKRKIIAKAKKIRQKVRERLYE